MNFFYRLIVLSFPNFWAITTSYHEGKLFVNSCFMKFYEKISLISLVVFSGNWCTGDMYTQNIFVVQYLVN